ncbi:hypothetical protein CDL12_29808 [Handroanthus impetiginosus]|uniref:Uncharacterized protein n=1 Tax=Handroanthus impetiginosus TaxID=429701 RepID=A0A2G9FXD2_9LAMI|nr:hypothetical protein CDL12_29808 [Handroanthus impetiginosus]
MGINAGKDGSQRIKKHLDTMSMTSCGRISKSVKWCARSLTFKHLLEELKGTINGLSEFVEGRINSVSQDVEALTNAIDMKIDVITIEVRLLKRAVELDTADNRPSFSKVKVPKRIPFGKARSVNELKKFLWDIETYVQAAKVLENEKVSIMNIYLVRNLHRQEMKDLSSAIATADRLLDFYGEPNPDHKKKNSRKDKGKATKSEKKDKFKKDKGRRQV